MFAGVVEVVVAVVVVVAAAWARLQWASGRMSAGEGV